MKARRIAMPVLIVSLLGGPVLADSRALILANERYDHASAISAADEALKAGPAFEAAGFTLIQGADLGSGDLRQRLAELLVDRDSTERMVILLAGHFVRSESGTWFLGTEARLPDLATVDGMGLSLATVLEIASGVPGGALVLLGGEERRIAVGNGLAVGIGTLAVPQGVTVVRGEAAQIAVLAERDLLVPGQSLAAMVSFRPDLIAEGFLSDLVPFLPADGSLQPGRDIAAEAERAFWEATRGLDTLEAYDAYLARYPGGTFSPEALAEVTRLRAEPGREARLAETALAFSLDQRRELQRALSLLGFKTRGIDGIFGAGTRAAIVAWQQKNGEAATSYLTRPQTVRILAQADRRAAELEAEAARRQAEQAALDRAFWSETGAAGDDAGLRAYLKRFPDGLFSEVAAERLAAIEDQHRAEAEAQDRADWDVAARQDTEAAYRTYLRSHSEGAFAEEAQGRIEALTQSDAEAALLAEARAVEEALGLNPLTRKLVEGRLDGLGLKPGPVDGLFDEATRRAIRRYQNARDLPVSGYLNEATLVRLLADTLTGQ